MIKYSEFDTNAFMNDVISLLKEIRGKNIKFIVASTPEEHKAIIAELKDFHNIDYVETHKFIIIDTNKGLWISANDTIDLLHKMRMFTKM